MSRLSQTWSNGAHGWKARKRISASRPQAGPKQVPSRSPVLTGQPHWAIIIMLRPWIGIKLLDTGDRVEWFNRNRKHWLHLSFHSFCGERLNWDLPPFFVDEAILRGCTSVRLAIAWNEKRMNEWWNNFGLNSCSKGSKGGGRACQQMPWAGTDSKQIVEELQESLKAAPLILANLPMRQWGSLETISPSYRLHFISWNTFLSAMQPSCCCCYFAKTG